MQPVRIGVVGAGVMGGLFAGIFRESPLAELTAVADLDRGRAESLAARLGVSAFADLAGMIEGAAVDAVAICTPEHLHVEPVRAAAAAGKHIFLEKPLATTVEDGERILALTRAAGVKLMVGHCLRFDPRFVQGYETIRRGDLGEIIHIRAWRETSIVNGQMYGARTRLPYYLGVHDIDILHWYIGSGVERVYAEGTRKLLTRLGVDDAVFAVLKFRNGALATLENSWVLPQTQNQLRSNTLDKGMEVVGTKGMVSIQAHNIGIVVQTEADLAYPDVLFSPPVQGRTPGIYQEELAHFLRCILEDREPAVSGEAALQAVRVACAIDQSCATAVPVLL